MALTIEEMEMIIVDMETVVTPRVKGEEADEFRKAIQPDIDLAKERGWVIDIPAIIIRNKFNEL